MKTQRLISIFFTVAALIVFMGGINPVAGAEGPRLGGHAPEITLYDLDRNIVSLVAMRGDVVILNFWATWCPHCKVELWQLDALEDVYESRGLRVIAVNTDTTADKVRRYLVDNPVRLRIALDPDTGVSRLYRVFYVPVSYIIDRRGKITHHFPGNVDWSSPRMKVIIEGLLENGGVADEAPLLKFR